MRAAVDHLVRGGQLLSWGIPATGVLVETLLDRGAEPDVAEAEAAIERLAAAAPAEEGLAWRDIWLLRSGAVLARAHGDEAPYRESRDRYYDMARTLGFEGHTAWAEAIIEGGEYSAIRRFRGSATPCRGGLRLHGQRRYLGDRIDRDTGCPPIRKYPQMLFAEVKA